MTRSTVFTRLGATITLVATLAGAAFAGQSRTVPGPTRDNGRIDPSQHHLDIVQLTVPPQVEEGKAFTVAVTAADRDGVWYLDVRHGEETRRFFAGGDQVVSFVATFERASLGPQDVRATAYDHNYTPGRPFLVPLIVVGLEKGRPDFEVSVTPPDPIYAQQVSGDVNRETMKAPAGMTWWTWWSSNYAKPYPWQTLCPGVSSVTPNGDVLHCWLNNNPQVRAHLVWEAISFTGEDDLGTEMGVGAPYPYDQWSGLQKQQLDVAFYYAYEYLKNGASNFGGTALPDVPANQIQLADNDPAYTLLKTSDAWRLYIGTIAHSLALEIGGFVPWSVVSYKPGDLDLLFNGHYLVNVQYFRFAGPSTPEQSFTGYAPYGRYAVAAPPVQTFQFLLNRDILRLTHADVLGEMLEYTRAHMVHLGGIPPLLDSLNTVMHEAVWGYRGHPTVAAMMNPRVMTDPTTNQTLYGGSTWAVSRGCWGAAEFFQAVLRAANIPVDVVPDEPRFGGGGHGTAEFHTANLALPDGDDAYNGERFANSVPMAPAGNILITQETRVAWFMDASLPWLHHGKHASDNMALDDLATVLVQDYCADKKMNLPHAGSSVALVFDPQDGFPPYYTVQDLETMNLWTALGAKASQLNFCK